MTTLNVLIVSIVGYLLGSISFAVIIARSQGVDILKFGSGNPGATNVTRALGAKWGRLVFALDAFKGYAAAGWPFFFMGKCGLNLAVVGLVAAIIGHSFSVFLRFRGGKGVATSMGGLLAIMPFVLFVGALVWGVVFLVSRMVALASILFALSLPVSAGFIHGVSDPRCVLGVLLGILIIVRHRSNIQRILRGDEHRFKSS